MFRARRTCLADWTIWPTQVRANLSTDPDVQKDLKGHSQYVLTKSVPALRAYDEGLQLSRSGKEQDAAKKFEEAISEDPNFAMAYSRLAQSYHSLGFDDKAEQASRRAVTLSDNLPAQQKYLVRSQSRRDHERHGEGDRGV